MFYGFRNFKDFSRLYHPIPPFFEHDRSHKSIWAHQHNGRKHDKIFSEFAGPARSNKMILRITNVLIYVTQYVLNESGVSCVFQVF